MIIKKDIKPPNKNFKLSPTKLVKFSDGKVVPMNRALRRLNKIK